MSASPVVLTVASQATMETWIPYGEALRLSKRTMQWMSAQVRAGVIRQREVARTLGNGRADRQVELSTLPADAQRRYERELERTIPQFDEPKQLPLLGRPQLVTSAPRVKLPAAKLSKAQQRHAILEPILAMEQEAARRVYADTLRLADGTPVTSQTRMVAYQVEQAALRGEDLTVRTVLRWLKRYREQPGVAALARSRRRDAGHSRYFDRPEHQAAAALVAYLHLGDGMSPGLSPQACFDMLHAQREIVGLPVLDLPHYSTVRTFLGRMPRALAVYARRGRKEFGERMLPYLSRGYTEPSNSIWVSDTMIADVEVMNDCIPGAPAGAPIRLRLTAIIDYRSRYVVGYSWAWEGSSASIATALRHAVTDHGPCELWYCDNGKDYCKVAKGAVPGYMQPGTVEPGEWAMREMRSIENSGALARLGIRVTHCIAHHPQSKHVERLFRTLHLTFCKLWATYTGGKPSERPDQTTALMQVHRRAVRRGDLSSSHHPLASEFMRRFEQWLPTYHNKRGHRGKGMDYRSPAEVFRAELNPQQRPAPSPDSLAVLLWDHKTAKVRECQVRVNNHDYAAADLQQSRLMMAFNERTVGVAFDPLDPSRIAVLDDAGHLVTMLEAKRLVRMAPDDPETQAQIAEMQQQRAALTRGLRQEHLAIVRAGKQLGVMHPLELLEAGSPDAKLPSLASRITPRKPRPTITVAPAAPTSTPTEAASALLRMLKEAR